MEHKHTYYYRVNNTWIRELKGEKQDHIYGVYEGFRDTPFSDEEYEYGKELIANAFMGLDSDVSREDVIFITKEEYEHNTSPEGEIICNLDEPI